MLFSATMPKQLMEFARAGLKDPEIVRLDVESTISDKLKVGCAFCGACTLQSMASSAHDV